MRNLLVIVAGLLTLGLYAQTPEPSHEGVVSYVTSQSVYVRFQNTGLISPGDTLYVQRNGKLVPSLLVNVVSSVSCVCSIITPDKYTVSDVIFRKPTAINPMAPPKATVEKTTLQAPDSSRLAKGEMKPVEHHVSGRVSLASYSNISSEGNNTQRFRYSLMLNTSGLIKGKLSTETYLTFAHRTNEWSAVKADIFNALRIYSLAVNYAFTPNHNLWFGRKINQRVSNLGAVDGIQYELKTGTITTGLVAGSRPDSYNYGINTSLFQAGGYISHDLSGKYGSTQSTLAFFEQTNKGNTDRRFVYLQHTNSLVNRFFFFGSAEVDLYKKKFNQVDSSLVQDNSPFLTNLYLSLRYRPGRNLSMALSYSARNNIIYYETYKDYLERLLEQQTSNGYLFQISWRLNQRLNLGANAGYRDRKGDLRPSKNLYTWLTFNRFIWKNVTANASATLLETPYLNGNVYSLGFNSDFLKGKFYTSTGYRYVSYRFVSGETTLNQHIGEFSFNWRVVKNLTASANVEATFEKGIQYQRIYINLTQRL